MSDYSEVTSESWFSRIKDSIKGVLTGLVLFVIAFPILWTNEGRAVRTAKSLEEGAGAVVSVAADKVDSANENKLIHLSGATVTKDVLTDDLFGVSFNGIKLARSVEMYQWIEEEKEETSKKVGGSKETKKTYTYKKDWSDDAVDSSEFKVKEGHVNPGPMPAKEQEWTAENVTLGAFKLPQRLIERVGRPATLNVDAAALAKVSPTFKAKAKVNNGQFYVGADPANPVVGDVRVSFKSIKPETVSIVSVQRGDSFEPYKAKAGGTVELLEQGNKPASEMFQSAQEGNAMLTWILRVLGFILMAAGVYLVARPVAVLGDVVPFFGSFLAFGAGLFGVLVALMFSTLTVAVAWLFYRPLVAILLLVLTGGGAAGLLGLRHRREMQKKAGA
jgi:hypothetical protein